MQDLFQARTARPMLIGKVTEPFDDGGSIFELKLDGERCLAYLEPGCTTLVNRRGIPITERLPELEDLHRQAGARCIVDGELITGIGGTADFEGIQARMQQRNRLKIQIGQRQFPVSLVAFDILYHESSDVTRLPLMERKALLEQTLSQSEKMALSRYIPEKGKAFFDLVIQQGLEGVIGKRMDSLYEPGKRTTQWVKVKHAQEDDYVICGYRRAEHVAMLMLGQYAPDGTMVYKGRTTLGLRNGAFGEIEKAPTAKTWPFAEPPPEATEPGVTWLAPALVCTVSFIARTQGGLMRQPHFVRMRPDKAPEEAILTE